ncbi:TonB-dependent siderophore receptor [Deminuibacter soli]|uniref:TonB-dependent siderophore receptor n=1 Tax=Deminuibacter soli TaxID=2291815 RepID=A0A3E1NE54_9BACT|nr:TonB-dependent siderophore receptor [Deminuibacter soli]RFM26157.1 TonB-dependent siderophore receptor [Deminuibacter soli]
MNWLRGFALFLLCFQLLAVHAIANGGEGDNENKNGHIKGKVLTADDKPAAAVSVNIQGSKKATLTEEDGSFSIDNVKPGDYQLEVSLVGYESSIVPVTVTEGKTASVSIMLKVSGQQLQDVTVKSGRNGYNARQVSPTLRLNEPLIDVSQNIQIVNSKVMTDQQITSMSDGLIRNVSGLMRLEHWGDLYTNISARGSRLSAFRNGMNTITSYWSPLTEDMSFVDHVEFVKGPAGFMMSVGDPAGIYNVVTKKPTGVTKGEASITLGSYDLYRASLDFDGKLDKEGKVLYRLNLMDQNKNSFRAYEFNDRYSIAPVLSFKLDDNTTLTAEYIRQHVKSSNVGSYYVFSTKGYATLPRDFSILDPGLEPTNITEQIATLSLAHKLDDNWKLFAQASYYDYRGVGSSMWATSVSADSMIRNVSIWDAVSTAKFAQAYLNGDVQTGAVHHRILAGIDANEKDYMADWNQNHDLDKADAQFNYANPSYGFPSNGYPVWDRTTPLAQRAGVYGTVKQSLVGLYVQDELGFLNNKLRLTLAGRYTHVKASEYAADSKANRVTPRIGLSYSINDNTSVYALLDQAFVPQTGFRKDGKSVKPLTGNNMEVGVKRDWAGGKWGSSLSVYRIIRNNENSTDPSDPTGRYVVQLGQTRAQGIEFDLHGEIIPGLTLTANYALTDNQITKTDTSAAGKATLHNKVPGYAKHTANAWLNYKIQSGILKGFGVSGGFTFLGERSTWTWTGATGEQALPDYTKFDGGIFWEKDRLRISCNVYNLADKYLYSGAAYGAYYYTQAEAGRNWRLGINYRF